MSPPHAVRAPLTLCGESEENACGDRDAARSAPSTSGSVRISPTSLPSLQASAFAEEDSKSAVGTVHSSGSGASFLAVPDRPMCGTPPGGSRGTPAYSPSASEPRTSHFHEPDTSCTNNLWLDAWIATVSRTVCAELASWRMFPSQVRNEARVAVDSILAQLHTHVHTDTIHSSCKELVNSTEKLFLLMHLFEERNFDGISDKTANAILEYLANWVLDDHTTVQCAAIAAAALFLATGAVRDPGVSLPKALVALETRLQECEEQREDEPWHGELRAVGILSRLIAARNETPSSQPLGDAADTAILAGHHRLYGNRVKSKGPIIEEPDSSTVPRVIVATRANGIAEHGSTKKRKRARGITWAPPEDLESVRYFEPHPNEYFVSSAREEALLEREAKGGKLLQMVFSRCALHIHMMMLYLPKKKLISGLCCALVYEMLKARRVDALLQGAQWRSPPLLALAAEDVVVRGSESTEKDKQARRCAETLSVPLASPEFVSNSPDEPQRRESGSARTEAPQFQFLAVAAPPQDASEAATDVMRGAGGQAGATPVENRASSSTLRDVSPEVVQQLLANPAVLARIHEYLSASEQSK